MNADAVAARAVAGMPAALELLGEYLRYPAISCEAEHASDVRALAARIRDDLEAMGLDRARVLELEGALPAVAAEWLGAGSDAPTVLIYGHLDLQPVAGEEWHSDPHEPTRRGDRLYARVIDAVYARGGTCVSAGELAAEAAAQVNA